MSEKRKVAFIIHAKIRNRERLQTKIQRIFQKDFDLSFALTNEQSGAKDASIEALTAGADFIVVAGGDGSINEMINAYFEFGDSTVVLGVLPMGTGNDFSKSLRVKNDLHALLGMIQNQQVHRVDVCLMAHIGTNGQPAQRYFINISDIGMGGLAVKHLNKSSKWMGSHLTYFYAVISSFFKYQKQKVRLKYDHATWEGQILSLCMANGKYFASGLCIAPDAKLDSGDFQLVVIGDVSLWVYFKNLLNLFQGRKIVHNEVFYDCTTQCEIIALDDACPIDMDGEFIGYTPVKVDTLKEKVPMLFV